ncbi:tryptophan 2,3-dioxygenase [Haloactinospora alba]|uniref:Tryptophan 2,3-dioxygenase n=1 Tax=Haloactinospora alba TaxID=405555 RepID=A0A543NHG0_9ACTN|nr:tryptophan 2,3-dioxygenase family protein [Haloactinospora alba]TQN31204.1 tryptophan 2,3-dioxygenase [Haloactinospora alba]
MVATSQEPWRSPTDTGQSGRGDGDPSLAAGQAVGYMRYGGIDTLLTLQRPLSSEPEEYSFLVTTQVMELLFALVRQRWERARDELEADSVTRACAELRRAHHAQDVLVQSWQLLETLTPTEFARFREELGAASGFHSPNYRHLEFLLGNKSAAMVRPYDGMPEISAPLEQALIQPGLYDAALRLLRRAGLPVPAERAERDWSQPYTPHTEVERAWAEVYADDRPENELFTLAETLVDTAERVTRWRHRHLMAVKRSLGAKPGTGGSAGLEWLARNAQQDVFPELWSLRGNI